jgi:ketosteroid isomerase-like protein
VKPDVAIAHVRTALTGDERYPGQTFEFRRIIVLTKHKTGWLILAGQNAKLNEGVK